MHLVKETYHETIINKSRFICYVSKIENEQQAKDYIVKVKKMHPDATTIAHAYICGQFNELHRSNDGGEPSGTAGVPMLEALKNSDVQDVVAVTVRYFGGIKLGAGGLIRAFSNSVTEVMKLAPKADLVKVIRYKIEFTYDLVGKIDYLLKDKTVLSKSYTENVCYIFESENKDVEKDLQELGKGKIPVINMGEFTVEKIL